MFFIGVPIRFAFSEFARGFPDLWVKMIYPRKFTASRTVISGFARRKICIQVFPFQSALRGTGIVACTKRQSNLTAQANAGKQTTIPARLVDAHSADTFFDS